MLAYAHDTQHEKIIRGLTLGIALIVYGQDIPDNKHFKSQAHVLKFQGWNLEQEGGHVTQVT